MTTMIVVTIIRGLFGRSRGRKKKKKGKIIEIIKREKIKRKKKRKKRKRRISCIYRPLYIYLCTYKDTHASSTCMYITYSYSREKRPQSRCEMARRMIITEQVENYVLCESLFFSLSYLSSFVCLIVAVRFAKINNRRSTDFRSVRANSPDFSTVRSKTGRSYLRQVIRYLLFETLFSSFID